MSLRLLGFLVASLLASLSYASQTFSNSGTTQGWSNINQEHKGSVQQVTTVVYNGCTAIK